MTLLKSETNQKEVEKKISDFEKRFLVKAKREIEAHSRLLITHIQTKYMKGKKSTDTTLASGSGQLARSMRAIIPAKVTEAGIEGGFTFGTIYAAVHIGPKGQETPIEPKVKKALTIPFPDSPILSKTGVLKASAGELKEGRLGMPFGRTFIKKGIIFGTKRIARGARLGEYRGGIIPLFILKKKVKIKTRIHPEVFLEWSKKDIKERMGDAVHVSVR